MRNLQYSLSAKISAFLLLFLVSVLCLASFLYFVSQYSWVGNISLVYWYSSVFQGSLIIFPISFIVSVLLLGFILASAGQKEGNRGIELNGIDRIYSDIYLFTAGILLLLGLTWLRSSIFYSERILFLVTTLFILFYVYIILMMSLITLTKRIRTQTLLSNSVSYRLLIFLGEVFNNLGAVYQSALAVMLFGLINGFLLLNIRSEGAQIAFVFFNIFIFCCRRPRTMSVRERFFLVRYGGVMA